MNINILSYPIDPTGKTLSSPAINQALLDCANSGGGIVELPAGTYLCGTIDMQSHTTLHLCNGATILGSEDIRDYHGTSRGCSWCWMPDPDVLRHPQAANPCPALIVADRKTNFAITGQGTIDGQRSFSHGYTEGKGRPFLIALSECQYATLRDLTLTNPGMFTVYGLNSSDLTLTNLTILTANSANGDGLDFDGGKRISISDCHLDVGDDGIGLKTLTPDEPCEDFTVTGCHIRSKHWGAVRIGPESAGAMRRINITNCCFYDSGDGLKFQLTQDADFEDFNISNITMQDVLRPIFFTKNRYNMSCRVPCIRPATGNFRRVHLSNITAKLREDSVFPNMTIYAGNYISALPGDTIDDITLDNVHMIAPGGGSQAEAERTEGHGEMYDFWGMYPEHLQNLGPYPGAVMYVRHARGVRMNNCTFETTRPDARAAVAAEDVTGLRMSDCEARNCGALLRHYRCEGLTLRDNFGEAITFSEAQAAAWEAERARSLAVDAALQTLADDYQTAAQLPVQNRAELELFAGEGRMVRGGISCLVKEGETLWLTVARVTGEFDVLCDNEDDKEEHLIASHRLPALYRSPMPYALRLDGLSEGEHMIYIEPASHMEEQRVTVSICTEAR